MYKPHTFCRACGYAKPRGPDYIKIEATNERLIEVFDLGIQPLANDFCRDGQERSGYAPLKVLFCPRCSLGQLSTVVRPEILYHRYSYVTSQSEMMKAHFRSLYTDLCADGYSGGNLLEIGSNDGTLLQTFKEFGYNVVGIDPAENLNEIAVRRGVQSICGLFSSESAKLLSSFVQPDIILARHVFCHIDDWHDVVKGFEILAKRNTLICIEAPYCKDMLENAEWDTIYHEHMSYLTLKAVDALLENTTLQLCRVRKYPIHGGAIMLFIRRRDADVERDPDLDLMVSNEAITVDSWREFDQQCEERREELISCVSQVVSSGSTVAGLGASAKSSVWINACKFTRKEIRFIADSTPQKWYTTSPGSNIPITDEGALLRELPDYTVLFAWNFRRECVEKNKLYLSQGGKFIVPVPKLDIVGAQPVLA